jgi:hypothetical protein
MERRSVMSDTPQTDEAQFGTGRVSVDFARRLERELVEAREQRDRLAEALREIDEARLDDFMGPHDMALKCVLIARESLAAVKGGSDECR